MVHAPKRGGKKNPHRADAPTVKASHNPAPTPPADAWENLAGLLETGCTLGKRVPVNRIETPCSIGMIVRAVDGDGEAIVIGVTPGHCIIQYESGEVDAIPWFGISIECVVPAGMPIARPYCSDHEEKRSPGQKMYPPAGKPLPLPTLNRAEVKS